MDDHIGVIAEQAGEACCRDGTGDAYFALTTANGARVRDVPFCHDYAQKGADKQGIH